MHENLRKPFQENLCGTHVSGGSSMSSLGPEDAKLDVVEFILGIFYFTEGGVLGLLNLAHGGVLGPLDGELGIFPRPLQLLLSIVQRLLEFVLGLLSHDRSLFS